MRCKETKRGLSCKPMARQAQLHTIFDRGVGALFLDGVRRTHESDSFLCNLSRAAFPPQWLLPPPPPLSGDA